MSLSEAHWEIGFTIGIIRHHTTLVGRRRRSQYGLLLEARVPGWRQPVKAASREVGAQNAPALRG